MEFGVICIANNHCCLWLQWNKKPNKRLHIWKIRRDITTIESLIFDFNPKITKATHSYQKYNVSNNHYPQQTSHYRRPTAKADIFPLSERLIVVVFIDDNYDSYQYAQTHVSIIRNSFGVILEVTDPNRVSVIGGPQWQPEFFRYLNVSLSFCFSATIKIQIKILKIMYVSSKPPLVSLSNL